jgi:hypothetical protein
MHAFKLISRQSVDFKTLLSTVFELTGKKISDHSDQSTFDMSPDVKLSTCLASLVGLSPSELSPTVNAHLTFTAIAVMELEDMNDILSMSANLKWLGANTNKRNVMVGLLTGNLNDWRDAVDTGFKSQRTIEFYQTVKQEFNLAGYAKLWSTQSPSQSRIGN